MTTSDRFPALDGLRGVAVLAVVLFHAGLLPYGYLGVDLFFALSGFLITGILLDARATGASAGAVLWPFYARRALRIFPLALLVGLVVIVATGAGWPGLWYLSYVQNWFPHPGPPRALAHYWSLAVEEQFYLVWPLLALALGPRALGRVAAVGLLAAAALRAWLMHAAPPWATAHVLGDWTLVRADPIAAGALVAILARTTGLERWDRARGPLVAVASAAAALALWWQAAATHTSRGYVLAETAIALATAGLVWTAVVRPMPGLTWRPLRALGTISYGVYLIHGAAGVWLRRVTEAPVPLALLTLAVSVPLAALSWRVLEQPILAAKRHVPMPTRATAAPASRIVAAR